MKAKDLKILRKRLAKVNRADHDVLQSSVSKESLTIHIGPSEGSTDLPSPPPSTTLSLTYATSSQLSEDQINVCLDLFRRNMAKQYEASSWGLDMEEKLLELKHERARFLLLCSDNNDRKLAAFVHFRFEYDDEESPSCAVLYVYEIQIEDTFRRHGIGRKLMGIVEVIAAKEEMSKALLTVFKANHAAMRFYEDLGYAIDDTSPNNEDYVILSRNIISPDKLT